jgi:catechol 2,3-dioxygenase-like lactoylglutathione lyase family enzyme
MFERDSKPAPINFHSATPILRVANLDASVRYYADVLGFEVDWRAEGVIVSVGRGPCHIFLSEGDQGNPGAWVWIGVGDAAALHDELRAKGAKVRQAPTNHPWALEIQVEDLDGNVLRFGSDPLEGRPFGEWLDMRGARWRKSPGGRWTRVPSG